MPPSRPTAPRRRPTSSRLGPGLQAEIQATPVPKNLFLPRYAKDRDRSSRTSSRSPRQVRDLGLGHSSDRQVRQQSSHGQTPQGPEGQRTLSVPGPIGGLGTDGPGHISARFKPLYDKVVDRSRTASFSQADETRYYVFGDTEGQTNNSKTSPHRWWLWIILTP